MVRVSSATLHTVGITVTVVGLIVVLVCTAWLLWLLVGYFKRTKIRPRTFLLVAVGFAVLCGAVAVFGDVAPNGNPVLYLALGIFMLIGGVGLYLLPSLIAVNRRHHNRRAIVVLNIFGGWTVVGWVGALVWASAATNRLPVETEVRRFCTRCGGAVTLDAQFCGRCGTALPT